ncbi:L-ascorbate oxidase-like [Hibiscus syriacus]|uniref:L-ascorbate oxidase-like n=1 Tax=Hibiscus syriacus TaxID=106335 RepID=A0A6A2WW69_HIBSY|nr:L-ascorbate oxidase-like [Hibiscus syriacus]
MEEPSPTPDPPTNQFGSLNDLAHELASLQDLATRGSWRSILDKVSRARSLNLLTSPHDHLIYLSYNVLAFSKLRCFSEASNEIDTLDDFNSNYYKYETYPRLYPNRSGSMIPFSLRFIHAQLPIKLGSRQEGYIQMQIGDIEGAKGSFNRVETMLNERKSDEYFLSEVQFRNLVNRNKALVYLVGKDYVSAVREYEECIERDHTDVVALNNKALCLMYLRDLSYSIKVLEKALERIPTIALDETLVINLCSMYELAYVNHSEIKRTLSNWIVHVAPDDFDVSCTRV